MKDHWINYGIKEGRIASLVFDSFIYPILAAFFHICFINCGNFIAYNVAKKIKISNKLLSIISGLILISIGIIRLLIE